MNLTKTCYKRDTFLQPILSNKFVVVLSVYFSENCFPVFLAGMFFQFGAPREQASKEEQASEPAKKQGRASKQASKRRSKEAGKEETKSEAASKYVRKKIRENKNRRRKERKHRLQACSEGIRCTGCCMCSTRVSCKSFGFCSTLDWFSKSIFLNLFLAPRHKQFEHECRIVTTWPTQPQLVYDVVVETGLSANTLPTGVEATDWSKSHGCTVTFPAQRILCVHESMKLGWMAESLSLPSDLEDVLVDDNPGVHSSEKCYVENEKQRCRLCHGWIASGAWALEQHKAHCNKTQRLPCSFGGKHGPLLVAAGCHACVCVPWLGGYCWVP